MTFIDLNGLMAPIESWVFYVVLSIIAVVVLGFYLLRSFGLYALAKKHGEKKGIWTAFFPIIWVYIAAKLAGVVALFGKKVKSFATIMLVISIVVEGLALFINVLHYAPIMGYYFQGGELLISATPNYFPIGSTYISTGSFYICMPNIVFPYSEGFWKVIDALYVVQRIFGLVHLLFMVFMYSAFFKTYLPAHSLVATVFSVLGLFPPFAFAVRKNEKIDYDQYIRAQYTAFYGAPPHGPNPYGGNQGGYYSRNTVNGQSNPFNEFDDKEKEPFSEFNDDGPFDEFEDKGDK